MRFVGVVLSVLFHYIFRHIFNINKSLREMAKFMIYLFQNTIWNVKDVYDP